MGTLESRLFRISAEFSNSKVLSRIRLASKDGFGDGEAALLLRATPPRLLGQTASVQLHPQPVQFGLHGPWLSWSPAKARRPSRALHNSALIRPTEELLH